MVSFCLNYYDDLIIKLKVIYVLKILIDFFYDYRKTHYLNLGTLQFHRQLKVTKNPFNTQWVPYFKNNYSKINDSSQVYSESLLNYNDIYYLQLKTPH